jgi:acetyltransferase-like isoleucine patch superfamily enzyme
MDNHALNELPPQSTAGDKTLLERYWQQPWVEKLNLVIRLCRGLILRHKLNNKGWIIAGPGVKLAKQNGLIHVDRLCLLNDSVQIAVVGHRPGSPACLSIGYNTHIMDRTRINVAESVSIGQQCNISWDCDIMDTDFHAIYDLEGKSQPVAQRIVIEDQVWIGANSIVLKGVTIGRQSVVAAGSVVTRDVPPFSLVGGNPARLIKHISRWSRNPPSEANGSATQ